MGTPSTHIHAGGSGVPAASFPIRVSKAGAPGSRRSRWWGEVGASLSPHPHPRKKPLARPVSGEKWKLSVSPHRTFPLRVALSRVAFSSPSCQTTGSNGRISPFPIQKAIPTAGTPFARQDWGCSSPGALTQDPPSPAWSPTRRKCLSAAFAFPLVVIQVLSGGSGVWWGLVWGAELRFRRGTNCRCEWVPRSRRGRRGASKGVQAWLQH